MRSYSLNTGSTSEDRDTWAWGWPGHHQIPCPAARWRYPHRSEGKKRLWNLCRLRQSGDADLSTASSSRGTTVFSGEVYALRHFKYTLGGDRTLRLDPDMIAYQAWHPLPCYLQDVFEPFGNNQAYGGALALQDGIGGYSGAVENTAQAGAIEFPLRPVPCAGLP